MADLSADIQKGFLNPPDDLSQLRLIDANRVQALAESVNAFPPEALGGKKLAVLIATGGTLATTGAQGAVRTLAYDWKAVFKPVEGLLQNRFEIVGFDAFCIDSSQMDYGYVRELAIVLTYLWNNVKVPFLGFLVSHGTDTMSYSAAAMSLITGQGLPFSVVYTGAQRPIDDPVSDAPLNLRNALYTLEALREKDMAEVVIVMGDRALLATSAEKVDDTALNAFDAPRHRYVAHLGRPSYPIALAEWLNPRRKVFFKPTIWCGDYAHTLVIKSTLGLNPKMLERQATDPDIHAIVLYSFGAGTVHEKVLESVMAAARARNLPVFIVNPVDAEYKAEYESAAYALMQGAVPLNMTLSSALAKIEIALRLYGRDLSSISRFMTENYVGEIPTDRSGATPRKQG